MIDNFDILLINQREIYFLNFENVKIKLLYKHRLLIYINLIGQIILFVIKLIHEQYLLIIAVNTVLSVCKYIFIKIIGFLCFHQIQNKMYDRTRNEIILLKNIYSH